MENEKRLMDEFKSEVMSKFIELCRGNDYNKLTLLRIGETIDRIYEKYSTTPAVDAAPVVYGRWEPHPKANGFEWCSVCHDCIIYDDWVEEPKWYYCPNCGAKMMDGDGNG